MKIFIPNNSNGMGRAVCPSSQFTAAFILVGSSIRTHPHAVMRVNHSPRRSPTKMRRLLCLALMIESATSLRSGIVTSHRQRHPTSATSKVAVRMGLSEGAQFPADVRAFEASLSSLIGTRITARLRSNPARRPSRSSALLARRPSSSFSVRMTRLRAQSRSLRLTTILQRSLTGVSACSASGQTRSR